MEILYDTILLLGGWTIWFDMLCLACYCADQHVQKMYK